MTDERVEKAMARAVEQELLAADKAALQLQGEATSSGAMGGSRHLLRLVELCEQHFSTTVRAGIGAVRRFAPSEMAVYRGNVQQLIEVLTPKVIDVFKHHGGDAPSFNRTSPREEGMLREKLSAAGLGILEEFDLEQANASVPSQTPVSSAPPYVDLGRLDALRTLPRTTWDYSRLVRLCEELNVAAAGDAFHAQAMLVRAILDHVPPLFGQPTFGAVVNNSAGAKSFKDAMRHLDGASRAVADGHLHIQIRAKESPPTSNQVDFRSGLDLLLAEVVRIA